MKKIAVFGNAGGGKSTVARRLAEVTGLPLIVLDILEYPEGYRSDRDGGGKISDEQYLTLHREILAGAEWIIDGYGSATSAWERFAVADTLVYVDLPLAMHYWGVTKRLVKGLLKTPPGWPENSRNQRQFTSKSPLIAMLPPASPAVEAPATEQNYDDYNDKNRGRVHGLRVLGQNTPDIRRAVDRHQTR